LKRAANLVSSIRSAARGTYSAYRTIPIRWRLAGGSAALTFVILLAFAWEVGVRTNSQVIDDFQHQVVTDAAQLPQNVGPLLQYDPHSKTLDCGDLLAPYASDEAQIRIFNYLTGQLLCTQEGALKPGKHLPAGLPQILPQQPGGSFAGSYDQPHPHYRIDAQLIKNAGPHTHYLLLYARPYSQVETTLAKIRFFLLLGVVGGSFLALLAGLATAGRATRPIAELTEAAREIERTRDPSRHIPMPEADDEIAELARTLEGMLGALDEARRETEASLERQREFVADASHELRTPLTSVLANLELLADELEGEQAESAKAALRSTRRMRRLVGDLLLLARADAQREQPVRELDLAEVLLDAASELGPMGEEHDLVIDARPAVVQGARDDLHRLVLNLLENAVRHTPPGTQVRAQTATDGEHAVLSVEDDGAGIPPGLAERVFERFVRGGGDGARGSGLGLAIVRAVAESHGGTVTLAPLRPGDPARPGTRFRIALPLAALPPVVESAPAAGPEPALRGRRRSA
jgi:two-component system OmpR family sensor kinase